MPRPLWYAVFYFLALAGLTLLALSYSWVWWLWFVWGWLIGPSIAVGWPTQSKARRGAVMSVPENPSAALPAPAEIVARLFPRRRSTLTVTIDLDPVPGWGHDPEDHRKWLQQHLNGAIGHYNPRVELTQGEPDV